jgi:hypothetical protein
VPGHSTTNIVRRSAKPPQVTKPPQAEKPPQSAKGAKSPKPGSKVKA